MTSQTQRNVIHLFEVNILLLTLYPRSGPLWSSSFGGSQDTTIVVPSTTFAWTLRGDDDGANKKEHITNSHILYSFCTGDTEVYTRTCFLCTRFNVLTGSSGNTVVVRSDVDFVADELVEVREGVGRRGRLRDCDASEITTGSLNGTILYVKAVDELVELLRNLKRMKMWTGSKLE